MKISVKFKFTKFTKITEMPDLCFGTSHKDVLCPKLEKNPAKPTMLEFPMDKVRECCTAA